MNFNFLELNNFSSRENEPIMTHAGDFVLKTCQRTLVLKFNQSNHHYSSQQALKLKGADAYAYLLEMICGLQSRLLGENEIVAQVRTEYQNYILSQERNPYLVTILEKLFKDAKSIRSQYLIGLGQKTYSSIARKYIYNKCNAKNVLIVGSGQLAEDLINQFKKKTKVTIAARNSSAVNSLIETHDIDMLPWSEDLNFENFPFIVNTIGTEQTIYQNTFFEKWSNLHQSKMFIDLGSPTCIETTMQKEDGVLRLEDIFKAGAIHEEHKLSQIAKAKMAIKETTINRKNIIEKKFKRDEIYKCEA